MELTKEYFDQIVGNLPTKKGIEELEKSLDQRLTKLATKDDLKNAISASEKKIIARIDEAQEELAIMTKNGFDDILARPDFKERVQKLEKEILSLKNALSLT